MNKAITKLVALLSILVASTVNQIAFIKYGWGISVQSYWAVIVCGVMIPVALYKLIGVVENADKD